MSEYTPDTWVILSITTADGTLVPKIFAGSYGGYTGGDSWKLSSAVKTETDHGDYLEVETETGSIYTLRKARHGMSAYQASILSAWVAKIESIGETVTLIPREEAFED